MSGDTRPGSAEFESFGKVEKPGVNDPKKKDEIDDVGRQGPKSSTQTPPAIGPNGRISSDRVENHPF